jgi:hypothetical protein
MTALPNKKDSFKANGHHEADPAGNGRPPSMRVTVMLPRTLIERLRNAVYWTGQSTLARLVTDAVEDVVVGLEQSNGGAFPPRLSPLKRGRPGRRPSVPRDSRGAGSRS